MSALISRAPRRLFHLVAAYLLLTSPGCFRRGLQEEPTTVPAAWRKTTKSLFNDAFADFRNLAEGKGQSGNETVEIMFGTALNLLNVQPKTSRNITQAREIFEGIILSHCESPYAPASKYYLARITELHQSEPDAAAAKRIYRDLIRSHPEHFYAQVAVIKYATLSLFELTSAENKHLLYEELESLVENLRDPHLKSLYHFLLTDCAFRFGLPLQKALVHAQAADGGLAWSRTRVDIYFWAGQAALDLGRYALAEHYFSRFLEASPRSIRAHYVRQLHDRARSEQHRTLLTPLFEVGSAEPHQ